MRSIIRRLKLDETVAPLMFFSSLCYAYMKLFYIDMFNNHHSSLIFTFSIFIVTAIYILKEIFNCNENAAIFLFLAPFEILTVFSYYSRFALLIISLTVLATCFSFNSLISFFRAENKNNLIYLVRRTITRIATIFICVFAVLITYLLVLYIAGYIAAENSMSEYKNRAEVTTEDSVSSGLKEVLDDDTWNGLSTIQRTEVINEIIRQETQRLGMPYEPKLQLSNDLPQNVLGQYNNSKKIIVINENYLSNSCARAVCQTVCHEVYHAYQYCMCEAYNSIDPSYQDLHMFRKVNIYLDELEHYVNGNVDVSAYSEQLLESDARKYAEATYHVCYENNNHSE